MFLTSGFFWFLMGAVFLLVVLAFNAFTKDQGWEMNWWKWLLSVLWYAIVCLSVFSYGTLAGEFEADAGVKIMLVGLGVAVVLGIILWRVLPPAKAKEA